MLATYICYEDATRKLLPWNFGYRVLVFTSILCSSLYEGLLKNFENINTSIEVWQAQKCKHVGTLGVVVRMSTLVSSANEAEDIFKIWRKISRHIVAHVISEYFSFIQRITSI